MNSFASPQTLVALPFPNREEDLYSRVFDAILEQHIDADSRFTEESLAQVFGVRRSDIRCVLTRLAHQQIIVLRVNHRPRVAALEVEQVRQTLHARRLTEITLVRLACQHSCPQDLKSLGALIDSERECNARGSAIRLSGEFHLQLAKMAGNAPLAHFLDSLVPLTALAVAQFEGNVAGYCDWQVHQGILEAVEYRDEVKAVALLNQHLDHLEEALVSSELLLSQNRVAG
ncbi:GntR family transcriptional regulator [Pseudomonas arsenicoxydans]|uniref:GntR family transcriptional regulator n=1 Tax=Pseudomonas arsenicoxydans TaxID=702115 RepID=A0A502HJI5_9PSED|nr:GntR family transcriptional regulator [Pseudomonas arsenicoxydans]TPG74957.1 GntR family transcriptional regulator [Pseudomonas arsenicoxydans]